MIKAVTPPQRTACSPNKSVSVSSLNVVSSTPDLAPPIAFEYAKAISLAFPLGSWCTATKHGTPDPSVYVLLTICPGPFGATINTSTSLGATIWPKFILNPWANAKAFPASKYGATCSLYIAACFSSGISIITISAALTASGTVATCNPSFSATFQDLLPSYKPTITSIPLSCRFNAWACPWLP